MTTELTEKVIVTDKEDMTSMEQLNGHESRPQSMASNAVYKSRREIDKKQKQLADYTAWVNNYLKRKPGVPLINDIRIGLQDGISFVNLVEIVSRAEVEGVVRYPTSADARSRNLELAVQLLKQDGVNIQPAEAVRDILEGNSKGIMRVVLGLAERYQPRSVKPRNTSEPKPQPLPREHGASNRHAFSSHMTAEHATVPRVRSPDVKKSNLATNSFSVPNINSIGPHVHANVGQSLSQTISHPLGVTHPLELANLSQPTSYEIAAEEKDMYSMPIDHLPPSATTRLIAPIRKKGVQLKIRPASNSIHSIPENRELLEGRRVSLGGVATNSWNFDLGMATEIHDVLSGLNAFKTELLQLHAVLLKNTDGTDINLLLRALKNENSSKEGVVSHDTPLEINSTAMLVEKQHLLVEKEEQMSVMRDQFSQQQDELTQLSAECSALRAMVEERDTFIKTMKTEIYRKEYKNDSAKVDLHHQLLQKDALVRKLEGEVQRCQQSLEAQQSGLEEVNQQLEEHKSAEIEYKVELDSLKMQLAKVSTTEESLLSKVANRDRKIGHLEEKLAELADGRGRRSETISDETESIRQSIVSLRRTLTPQDPQQQVLDNLEQFISDLVCKMMERACSSPTGKMAGGSPTGKRSKRHAHRGENDDHHRDKDRDRERRRRHKDRHAPHPDKQDVATPPSSGPNTKVIYYILNDRKETPYATVVPKKSGDITLRDFKAAFDRPGSFRFFVKTEDPDCGVVKEEIKHDDTILPIWKGHIEVWISEKSQHR